jgi:hypothetical protein
MNANTEEVYITGNLDSKYTALAYKTARLLRKVADNVSPSFMEGGFSGIFGLEQLAASGKESI